jgi:hypothetical protein
MNSADLAVVANFFVKEEADEERYLLAYFEEPARRIQARSTTGRSRTANR